MRPTRHLATITALAAVTGVLAACNGSDPAPTTSPTVASSSPTATPSPSPTTAKDKAFAAADATYREWIKNYAEAWKSYDPAIVNKDLVSSGLYAFATSEVAKFAKDKADGGHANFTIDVKTWEGTNYRPEDLSIKYCQIVNNRFIDKSGSDITRDSAGSPKPVSTTYKASEITFVTTDGGTTWRVDRFVQSPDQGDPC